MAAGSEALAAEKAKASVAAKVGTRSTGSRRSPG